MNCSEPEFPLENLRKLDEKITNLDQMEMVLPVFPKEELECLLDASIDLCRKGLDVQSEACQRFFRESLTSAFRKILTNDVVSSLTSTDNCVNIHCEKLVKLCIYKLDDDSLPMLDLLAMVLDPSNKFHTFHAAKQSESVPNGSDIPDEKLYARPPADPENPRGSLVDLINKFGYLGGFLILQSRFQSCRRVLTIPIIRALIRPFGLCHELLTVSTVEKYLLPIFEKVREILDALTDEELKQMAQEEPISHDMSVIIKTMTTLASHVPKHKSVIGNLESSRLKIILRLQEIVENVPEVLGNFVFNLTSEELDCFFQGVEWSWLNEDTEEREKLLDFIRRLLAYDQNGAMMDKVLTVFWNVAHSDDVSTEVMELALKTHLELLDHPSTQDREALKNVWLDKCAEELKNNDNWALPAIKQIRNICNSLFESQANRQPNDLISYKKEVSRRLIKHYSIWSSIENSLKNYINKVRELVRQNPEMDATTFMPDGWYNHVTQVQERLDFYTFILRHSGYVLIIQEATDQWQCLEEQQIFPSDREACLKWFIELISAERSFIDVTNYKDIFEQVILQFDPALLTGNGFTCFEIFFKKVNIQERKLTEENESFLLDDVNLIGKDYLWQIITNSQEDIAHRGIKLLLEVYKNLGSQFPMSVSEFQMTFVAECTSRFQMHCGTLSDLTEIWKLKDKMDEERTNKVVMETLKINRVKEVQKKYMTQCNIPLPAINNGAQETNNSGQNTN